MLERAFISTSEILSAGEFFKELEQKFSLRFSSDQNVNFSKMPD
jgi:hypothetical protein